MCGLVGCAGMVVLKSVLHGVFVRFAGDRLWGCAARAHICGLCTKNEHAFV